MGDIVATGLFLLILITFGQVGWDLYTYEDRQKKWEREHPGATYIRGYRKLERKSMKAHKMVGEL